MQVPSGFRVAKRRKAACRGSTFSAPSGRGRWGLTRLGASMFDLRSRAGIVGVATGAALLALPVVAAGQVPVVDQVVAGVTQTARSLGPARQVELSAPARKPAPRPVATPPAPALAAPPASAREAPPASVPAAPPALLPATPAPAARGMTSPALSAGRQAASSPAPKAKASDARRDGAAASAASDDAASDAQTD